MKNLFFTLILLCFMPAAMAAKYYGKALCAYPQYECVKVGRGENWKRMFPDPEKRDIVQRINRTYNAIWHGKVIVVPKNLENLTVFDVSPFPLKLNNTTEKQIIVDQDKLAFAAYDAEGRLVRWGPISSGRDRCVDSNGSCLTITGVFRMFNKENKHCQSRAFDNARMPYCMFFHKGFALHGSNDVPGKRASHGCVRMFTRDAKWLNQHFVELSNESNNHLGTKVIVRPLTDQ